MHNIHLYSFENLQVYQSARTLVKTIYQILPYYPKYEQYALCDQLRRSSVSILSNIAEGSGKSSLKDQIHYVETAYSSLMEVLAQAQISIDMNYISTDQYNTIKTLIDTEGKLLSGYRKSLQTRLSDTK